MAESIKVVETEPVSSKRAALLSRTVSIGSVVAGIFLLQTIMYVVLFPDAATAPAYHTGVLVMILPAAIGLSIGIAIRDRDSVLFGIVSVCVLMFFGGFLYAMNGLTF